MISAETGAKLMTAFTLTVLVSLLGVGAAFLVLWNPWVFVTMAMIVVFILFYMVVDFAVEPTG